MSSKITPISKKLQPLINNSDLADVKFFIGKDEEEFYGHKFLLSITSPMWRTMFYSSNWNETKNNGLSEVKMRDIDPEVFLKILQFSYIRRIELEEDIAVRVLKAADKFMMKELKDCCFEFLINNLNVKNAIGIYQEILNMNDQRQMERTLKYISTRRDVLSTANCLVNVNNQTAHKILECQALFVKEIVLFKRLIERILSKKKRIQRNSLDSQKKIQSLHMSKSNTKIEEKNEQLSEEFKENENKNENNYQNNKNKGNNKNKNLEYNFNGFESEHGTQIAKKRMGTKKKENKKKENKKKENKKKENKKQKNIWFATDQNLKELLDDVPFKFTLVRCLKDEWIEFIDRKDLELLTKIQWTRFIENEYQHILDTKIFNKAKIEKYLNFKKELNLPLTYIGINGQLDYRILSQLSRKPRIKKSEIKVMVLAAHNNILRRLDVVESIRSTGISHVKEINLCERTPSYKEVKDYDAILIFSLSNFESPKKVGNLLAKFVDNLGGIVVCTINALRNDNNDKRGLKGRIIDEDYLPIKKGVEISQERRILGKVEAKTHFIMQNVKTFDVGRNSWHIKTKKVTKNSTVICRYDNGNIMIAEKIEPERGKVVVLNFFPVSDSVRNNDEYWLTNTDGYHILANSVEYVAQK
ncbi:btb/poz domain-containing [Anaeramoeba flamelloides]|uniref:Btb/poz domain-containing n=1 Tax=Anaeramoeba flamelloides TaxID=1746091 RepID=A0ABQ8YYC9_9EUKA|nr:btb/poz domain-containing [Anaeramoeba flamelloides]